MVHTVQLLFFLLISKFSRFGYQNHSNVGPPFDCKYLQFHNALLIFMVGTTHCSNVSCIAFIPLGEALQGARSRSHCSNCGCTSEFRNDELFGWRSFWGSKSIITCPWSYWIILSFSDLVRLFSVFSIHCGEKHLVVMRPTDLFWLATRFMFDLWWA